MQVECPLVREIVPKAFKRKSPSLIPFVPQHCNHFSEYGETLIVLEPEDLQPKVQFEAKLTIALSPASAAWENGFTARPEEAAQTLKIAVPDGSVGN